MEKTATRDGGMRVSRSITQFMDFNFEQRKQGNHEAIKETMGITGKSYSFQIRRDEYIRGMWNVNGDRKAGGSRLETLEEMQWSRPTVRQKDASKTEGGGRSTKQ